MSGAKWLGGSMIIHDKKDKIFFKVFFSSHCSVHAMHTLIERDMHVWPHRFLELYVPVHTLLERGIIPSCMYVRSSAEVR